MLRNIISNTPVPQDGNVKVCECMRAHTFPTIILSEQDLSLLDYGMFALQTVILLPCKAIAATLPERGFFC